MALPPPAAQELLLALSDPAQPGVIDGLKGLLLDLAAAWKLLQNSEGQAQGPPDSAVDPTFVHDMLDYMAGNMLPCCEHFLRAVVAGGALPSSELLAGHPAAAVQTGVRGSWRTALVDKVRRMTVGPARALKGGPDAELEARYASWRLQQGRRLDVAAALFLTLICSAHLAKRLLQVPYEAEVARQMVARIVARLAAFIGPWLLLACGSTQVRHQRSLIVCLQGLLRMVARAAGVYLLLPLPSVYQTVFSRGAEHLCVFGVFLPALNRCASPSSISAPCLPLKKFSRRSDPLPFSTYGKPGLVMMTVGSSDQVITRPGHE